MAIVEVTRPVTGGVDTHLDAHVAAVLDGTGGVLGVESFPTTPAGFIELHDWMIRFGDIERVGVEGRSVVEDVEIGEPPKVVEHEAGAEAHGPPRDEVLVDALGMVLEHRS